MLRLRTAAPRRAADGFVSFALVLAAAALAACSDGGGTQPPDPDYTLAVRAGDAQTAAAGSRVGTALQVVVTSTADEPVQGAVVHFKVLPGSDAVLDDTLAVSGLGGIASTGLTMGGYPDTAKVEAFVKGHEDEAIVFSIVATPGPTVTGVSPTSLVPGDTIVVKGKYFSTELSSDLVYVGSTRARILSASGDTLLRVVVPPCASGTTGVLTVQVGSATAPFNGVTYSAGQYTIGANQLDGVVLAAPDVGSCLQLLGGNRRYLLVPQLASGSDTVQSATYTLTASTTGSALQAAIAEGTASQAAEGNRAQLAFDMRMRETERELAPQTARDAETIRAEGPALQALEVGSTRVFNVLGSLTGDVTFRKDTAVLKYVGSKTLLYYDQAAPAVGGTGAPTDADLAAFGKQFDQTLHEIAVKNFGSESDIDNNGHVIVLMSEAVNALTGRDCSAGSVIGFFYPNDFTNNKGTNKGEILYVLAPDPTGKYSCSHTLNEVLSVTPSTMIHEFQHMINHNQHVLVRKGPAENVWLNEGLSILAEELGSRYYEDKCPPPACRSSGAGQLFPDSSQGYILNLLRNAFDYLSAPAASSVTTFRDFGTLPERGGAWLFVRWLVDQKGDAIIPRLVQTSRTSISNVEFASGESFPSLFGDFSIALYADSLPDVPRSAIPPRYRFQSRNLRAIFYRLFQTGRVPREFPIQTRTLAPPASLDGTIVQGSMEYLVMPTTPAVPGVTLRFTAQGGGAIPAGLRPQIGILRLP